MQTRLFINFPDHCHLLWHIYRMSYRSCENRDGLTQIPWSVVTSALIESCLSYPMKNMIYSHQISPQEWNYLLLVSNQNRNVFIFSSIMEIYEVRDDDRMLEKKFRFVNYLPLCIPGPDFMNAPVVLLAPNSASQTVGSELSTYYIYFDQASCVLRCRPTKLKFKAPHNETNC